MHSCLVMEVVTVIAVMESRKRTRRKRIKKEKDDKEDEEKIPIREGVSVCGEEAATLPPLALPQAAGRP